MRSIAKGAEVSSATCTGAPCRDAPSEQAESIAAQATARSNSLARIRTRTDAARRRLDNIADHYTGGPAAGPFNTTRAERRLSQPSSGIQLPWKPKGTRWGSWIRATGGLVISVASSTWNSVSPEASSWM